MHGWALAIPVRTHLWVLGSQGAGPWQGTSPGEAEAGPSEDGPSEAGPSGGSQQAGMTVRDQQHTCSDTHSDACMSVHMGTHTSTPESFQAGPNK